jgi:PilZ domain
MHYHYLQGEAMTDVRDVKRHRKRMTMKFGVDQPSRVAFTDDISQQGICIRTAMVCPPGSRLKIELNLPDGTVAKLEGIVMWAKKVPANMIHLVKKCGMGVRITLIQSGEGEYLRLCDEMHEK